MKDQKDRSTGDLLATPNARRQASYAQRQRDLGRKQVSFWVTPPEAEALKKRLASLRKKAEAEALSLTSDTPPPASAARTDAQRPRARKTRG